jgi:uncharacterized protein (TIGR02757 family)
MNPRVKALLDAKLLEYNQPGFIADDPISIPHRFSRKQDIEITAFWVSMLAWGQRKSIINSANKLIALMDNAPHDFVLNHAETDRKRFLDFVHRTFNATDALYFLDFFQRYYQQHDSLEQAFSRFISPADEHVEAALIGFHRLFFDHPYAPQRTRKHVSTPERKSTCKRLNMFLRWMVRQDNAGVDFGIWQEIKPGQLLVPLDVHVERQARMLGLIERKQTDWQTVLELSATLRQLDPSDPVKYDYALFGMGVR